MLLTNAFNLGTRFSNSKMDMNIVKNRKIYIKNISEESDLNYEEYIETEQVHLIIFRMKLHHQNPICIVCNWTGIIQSVLKILNYNYEV